MMLFPVSMILSLTATGIKKLLERISWRYLARKRMELSTEIPKVILKISAVLAFNGISNKPISPAVIISANRFGTSEIMIILTLAKRIAMESVMSTNARSKLS